MWDPMKGKIKGKIMQKKLYLICYNKQESTKQIICNIKITMMVRLTIHINQAYLRVNEAVSLDN